MSLKSIFLIAASIQAVAMVTVLADEAEAVSEKSEVAQPVIPASNQDFCFFSGKPPSDITYSKLKDVKVGKGTYGGVKEILPKLVVEAKEAGADAIVDYTGSQRFGFWPWRMVRPVVRGTAVKWVGDKKPDCAAIGGTTLATILATDRAPEK